MPAAVLKMALIGCGRISHKHIDSLVANSDCIEAVGFADPVLENRAKRCESYVQHMQEKGITVNPSHYADYREMLDKTKPDFVAIATESGYHPEIAIYALNRKIHVICEKPMALSIRDADAMIAAAEANGVELAVSFQNRFNSTISATRRALDEGRFGRVMYGVASVRWNRGMDYYRQAPWRGTWKLDGGTLMNQCTHNIDLLQWFMGGDAIEVYGVTAQYLRDIEAEDFGSAVVKFKNGSVGIIEGTADIFPRNFEETLFLSGTAGTVQLGGLAVNKFEVWRFADSETRGDVEEKVLGNSYELGTDFQAVYGFGHQALYKDFHSALTTGKKPAITRREGKKALEIILAIYKSQKEGGPVKLPLTDFSTMDMSTNSLFVHKQE